MKRLALPPNAIERARTPRRDATDAERALWAILRESFAGFRFRRQVPIGPYFADFLSHRAGLVIEVDGGQHAEAHAYDARRTAFVEREGYRVLRLWNNDVLANSEGSHAAIANALASPPPCGEGSGVGARSRLRAEETPGNASAKVLIGPQTRPGPHPSLPHRGEGVIGAQRP